MAILRPRDICSAAFENDLRRLQLLSTEHAPGGVENLEEEELEEEEEAAIDADEEMVRIREMYSLPDEEEEDDEDWGEGDADPAEIEAEAEEQSADLERFRLIIRRKLRQRFIAAELNKMGLLVAGTNPATVKSYGVLFQSREVSSTIAPQPAASSGAADGGSGCGDSSAARMDADNSAADITLLQVRWLPSKRSSYPAYPLHWAVLGRAHDAVRHLILNGADPAKEVGDHLPAGTFPGGLTAEHMAVANGSTKTLAVLREAIEERDAAHHSVESAKQKIESQLEQRKAKKEKRKLERDQRRAAEEERRAAEEEEGEEDDGALDVEEDEDDL